MREYLERFVPRVRHVEPQFHEQSLRVGKRIRVQHHWEPAAADCIRRRDGALYALLFHCQPASQQLRVLCAAASSKGGVSTPHNMAGMGNHPSAMVIVSALRSTIGLSNVPSLLWFATTASYV